MQLKNGLTSETKVNIKVHDKHNAGRSPSTRWGKVTFDANGDGELIGVPISQLTTVQSLGWISDDQMSEFYDYPEPKTDGVSYADGPTEEEIQALIARVREAEHSSTELRRELMEVRVLNDAANNSQIAKDNLIAGLQQKLTASEARNTELQQKLTAVEAKLADSQPKKR